MLVVMVPAEVARGVLVWLRSERSVVTGFHQHDWSAVQGLEALDREGYDLLLCHGPGRVFDAPRAAEARRAHVPDLDAV